MIASLTGILKVKTPTEVTVDVHGIGYAIHIPLSTFERVGELGSSVTLFTHLHVREDALQLYGFSTEAERNSFRLLISVSGIGPRIAQGILSGISVIDLKSHIARGNAAALTSIPGIGRKTAERLILELKEKFEKDPGIETISPAHRANADVRAEALAALISLGYHRSVAESAIRNALTTNDGVTDTVERLLKAALKIATAAK